METTTIAGHDIEYYSSVDEMPIGRFFAYNKHLIIDSGIGADMQSIDTHIARILQMLQKDDVKNAKQELLNMRTAFYYVTDEFNPKFTSFACLIATVDGKPFRDTSDESLRRMVDRLAEWSTPRGFINQIVDTVKKKARRSWRYISRLFSIRPQPRNTMGDLNAEPFSSLTR